MTYAHDLADRLRGGPEWSCQNGCASHPTITVDVRLDGPLPRVPDYPPVPPHLARTITMDVWDWRKFLGAPGGEGHYCPAHDVISECLDTQGMWEGYGTLLVLDHLDRTDGLVVDVGSQIGWYSALAASCGNDVLAIDADPECVPLSIFNPSMNDTRTNATVGVRGTIGSGTAPVPLPPEGERVALLKADVEGAEDHVVRVFRPLIDARLIDAMLLEVSPVFADHYPDTLRVILDAGYRMWLVPEKGTDLAAFGADPLGWLERNGEWLDPDDLEQMLATFAQRDVWCSL